MKSNVTKIMGLCQKALHVTAFHWLLLHVVFSRFVVSLIEQPSLFVNILQGIIWTRNTFRTVILYLIWSWMISAYQIFFLMPDQRTGSRRWGNWENVEWSVAHQEIWIETCALGCFEVSINLYLPYHDPLNVS